MKRNLGFVAVVLALLGTGCEKLPDLPTPPNLPPIVSFIFTPVSPIYAGQTNVTFNASPSHDSDGNIVLYVWNFGDGTAEQSSAGPVITHVFPDTAERCTLVTYAVLMTAVDDQNGRASASQNVTVIELPAPTSLECRP